MIEELNKYRYIKKTKSELESDKIINDINNKLWNNAGYMTIYNLGAVMQLKVIAQALRKYDYLKKDHILMLMNSYKDSEGVSDLVNAILEEFDYKENNNV